MVVQSQLVTYHSFISCFPQMKPERSGAPDGESEQSGDRQSQPEQSQKEEDVEMTEDEKAVLNLLNVSTPMDLNALKGQTGLSNKKWDKAIKGLTKNKLAKVEKNDEGLWVSVV